MIVKLITLPFRLTALGLKKIVETPGATYRKIKYDTRRVPEFTRRASKSSARNVKKKAAWWKD